MVNNNVQYNSDSNQLVLHESSKISPTTYFFRKLLYIITFQKNKLIELEDQINNNTIIETNTIEYDAEAAKKQKRLDKISDSRKRLDKLVMYEKLADGTKYSDIITKILLTSNKIHYRFVDDIDLNIYKLEQFHTYHTDPFCKMIDEAFADLVNFRPKKIIQKELKKPELKVETKPSLSTEPINDIFEIVDRNVFNVVQNTLLSMKDDWKIKLPNNEDLKSLDDVTLKFNKVYEFNKTIKNKPSDYVYIGSIHDVYVVFLHNDKKSFIQYNIITNFPRVVYIK